MPRALTMFCFVLLFASPSFAQNTLTSEPAGDDAFVNDLNLRLQTMQLALNESLNLESDLELIDDQRVALATLTQDYKQMVQGLNELEESKGGVRAGLASCLRKMDAFEDRLSSEILLPHQNTALRSMVFAELVKDQGGDLISTLSTYYPKQFQLEDSQKVKIKNIKKVAREKLKKAKEEFEKKLKEISKETEVEFRKVLKPEQSDLLTELQGQGT